MIFNFKLQLAALLPVVILVGACSPGAGQAAETGTPSASNTVPAIVTQVTVAATISAAANTSAAPSATPNAAATTTPTAAATTTSTTAATSTQSAVATSIVAARATATPSAIAPITTTGAVRTGANGTSVTAVTVKEYSFQPPLVQVKAGTTVTWSNTDNTLHTVTNGTLLSTNKAFDSVFFTQGESVSLTFMQPGEYQYFCKLHNSMMGKVTVIP